MIAFRLWVHFSPQIVTPHEDLLRAGFGLGISLALAFIINDQLSIGAIILSKLSQ